MALMRYLPPNAVVEGGSIRFAGDDLLAAVDRLFGGKVAQVR